MDSEDTIDVSMKELCSKRDHNMKHVLSVILLIIIGLGCSSEKELTPLSDHFYGVWANKDCELVRTAEYYLLFQRYGNSIAATIQRVDFNEDSVTYDSRAAALFNTNSKKAVMRAKDLFEGDEIIVNTDPENTFRLTNYTCLVENGPDSIVLSYFEKPLEVIYKKDNSIKFQSPDGTWQILTKIENIKPTEPYLMRELTENNIGECLQEWSLGVGHLEDPAGYDIGIPINTNRHSFIFAFAAYQDQLNIFCRAARIRSDNNGTVFKPNIKLVSAGEVYEALMVEDNLAEAGADLEIVDSLFKPDTFNATEQGEYWSLKAYEDSVITLNGSGQFYHYVPTPMDSDKLLEWLEYIDYEQAGM